MAAQRVYRSMNGGEDFTPISTDLTRNLPQGNVPYSTISTLDESPLEFGLLIAGTDDGYVQKLENGTWKRIDNGLPEKKWVSFVQASPHDKNTFFVSLNGYREDDFSTYMYRASDGGATWQTLKGDMPEVVINAVLQDPVSSSLLYAGTDHGLYISLDGGQHWMYASQVPNVSVYDLIVHPRENELVVATHGRSMYVMDVKPLQQASMEKEKMVLYAPSSVRYSKQWGEKRYEWSDPYLPEYNVMYYAPGKGEVTFSVKDADGEEVASWKESSGTPFAKTTWDLKTKGKKGTYVEKGKYILTATQGSYTATQEVEIK